MEYFDIVKEPVLAKALKRNKEKLLTAVKEQERTGKEHGFFLFEKKGIFSNKFVTSPLIKGEESRIRVSTPDEKNMVFFHTHPSEPKSRIPSFFDFKNVAKGEKHYQNISIIGTTDFRGPVIDAFVLKRQNGRLLPLTMEMTRGRSEKKYMENIHKIWNWVDLR